MSDSRLWAQCSRGVGCPLVPDEDEKPDLDFPDYSDEIREELGLLLTDTPPGEWGELGLCPGPYGCLFGSEAEAVAAGVREHFCPDCRVIRVYKPR